MDDILDPQDQLVAIDDRHCNGYTSMRAPCALSSGHRGDCADQATAYQRILALKFAIPSGGRTDYHEGDLYAGVL